MKRKLFLAMLLCSLFLACSNPGGSEDDKELRAGEFTGLVGENQATGLYEELAGTAEFSFGRTDSVFEISLYSNVVSQIALTEVLFKMKSLDLLAEGNYTFSNIDDTSMVFPNSLSGFYLSPEIGDSVQYYSESGTLTITESFADTLKGDFDVKIFAKGQIDEDEYERIYSTIEGQFHALIKQ